MIARFAAIAAGIEIVLRAGRPSKPRRFAARQADAAGGPDSDTLRSDTAYDQRIAAQIFDAFDAGPNSTLEGDLDMLGANADDGIRMLDAKKDRTVGSGNHGPARGGHKPQ